MKKRFALLLMALSIMSINALPVQAAVKLQNNKKKAFVVKPGQWCFELPWMGIFCYKL